MSQIYEVGDVLVRKSRGYFMGEYDDDVFVYIFGNDIEKVVIGNILLEREFNHELVSIDGGKFYLTADEINKYFDKI